MHRLVIVSGPNRGSSYSLNEGDNSIGRQLDNHIVLTSAKVSKRHCVLSVHQNQVLFRDEGSTNGTFVNGAITRSQPLKAGDRIGVGDFVLQLVSPAGSALPVSQNSHSALNYQPEPELKIQSRRPSLSEVKQVVVEPDDLASKLRIIFEGKVMPQFYGMLMNNEWTSLIGTFVFGLSILAVIAGILPVQDLAEQSIRKEAGLRSRVLAREVADRFAENIANHSESQIDFSLLESEPSIKLAAILSPNLQIIAPQSRLNQIFAAGKESIYAQRVAAEFKAGRETGAGVVMDEISTAIWIEPIKTIDPKKAQSQVSAMVLVAIDYSGNLLAGGGLGVAYGTSLFISLILAFLCVQILRRLSLKPFEVLNEEIDQVLRGEIGKVTQEFKISELNSLWSNINSAVQRVGKSDENSSEGIVNWDQVLAPIKQVAEMSGFGYLAIDQSSVIIGMNPVFEEMSGLRSDSIGMSVVSAGDQPLSTLVSDLKTQLSNPMSRSATDQFEFQGIAYQVAASGFHENGQFAMAMIFRKKE